MLKRIDLKRDYEKHKEEYLDAIQKCCEDTAFSGGKYADNFEKEFAEYTTERAQFTAPLRLWESEQAMKLSFRPILISHPHGE